MFDLELKEEVFFPSSALRSPEDEQMFAELDKLSTQLTAICDIAHEVTVIENRFTGTDFSILNKEVVLQGLIKVLPFHMQTQLNADEFISVESISEKFKAFKTKVGETLLRIWEAIRKFFAKLASGYNRKSAAAKKRAAVFTAGVTIQPIPATPGMATLVNFKTLTNENFYDEVSEGLYKTVRVLTLDKAFSGILADILSMTVDLSTLTKGDELTKSVNFNIGETMGDPDKEISEKDLPLRRDLYRGTVRSAVLELKSFSNPIVTIEKDLKDMPKAPYVLTQTRMTKGDAAGLLERVGNGYKALAAYMEKDDLDRKVREIIRKMDEEKDQAQLKEVRRFGTFFANYYKAVGDYCGQALDAAYYITGYMHPAKDVEGVADEFDATKALPHKK